MGVEAARAETLEGLASLLAVSNQREGPFSDRACDSLILVVELFLRGQIGVCYVEAGARSSASA